MKIVIATGIYPPEIGGPAQYAKNLKAEFEANGHRVKVLTYRLEKKMPTGFRHLWFFLRCFLAFPRSDLVVALDTFSVAMPAVAAARLLGKKIIIRTGGDFLWEWYVERTGDLVLLKDFYQTRLDKLNFKEKIVFKLSRWTVRNASRLIFSTEWQKRIWLPVYGFDEAKTTIVENYYGPKGPSFPSPEKNFLAGTRPLKWKNSARLAEAFNKAKVKNARIIYDNATKPFEKFMDKVAHCHAVILASLGDVSPNFILDAIRHNKPFILTKETGLYARLKDIGIFVDPENTDDIADKILYLADEKNYEQCRKKIESFNWTHTWSQIADEFLTVYSKIK
ncbi:MAG: glycosyltransferase family 4 protein [Patescibacteria group bacterium]